MRNKMKAYVLTLSVVFPVTHRRAGERTNFKEKRANAIYRMRHPEVFEPCEPNNGDEKYHTIRGNYELWHKRFEEIERGEAYLSIRQWSGKPYASKQIEIARLTKEDGIGIQLLCFAGNQTKKDRELHRPIVGGTREIDYRQLAMNDGLTVEDWEDWFSNPDYDLREPMAIIQLTKFRY